MKDCVCVLLKRPRVFGMKGETLEEGAQEVARALTHRRLGCADRSRSHMCVCVCVIEGGRERGKYREKTFGLIRCAK